MERAVDEAIREARERVDEGDPGGALARGVEALEAHRGDPAAELAVGRFILEELGRLDWPRAILADLTRPLPPDQVPEACLLEARLHLHAGRLDEAGEALDEAEAAAAEAPDAPATRGRIALERGLCRFEAWRFDRARDAFAEATERLPDRADAWWNLALAADRLDDEETAAEAFERAAELDPWGFPLPPRIDPSAFDRAVREAIEELPALIREPLERMEVVVEAYPRVEVIGEDPDLGPRILGLFHGTPVGDLAAHLPGWSPEAILLFQRNIENVTTSPAEAIEEARITLLHEVGHLVGLDEDDLAALDLA